MNENLKERFKCNCYIWKHKFHTIADVIKVGDPLKDHSCWVRPENMKTPRTVLKIDESDPGSEIAAETAAAMASSSIVFRNMNHTYARRLLNKAKLVVVIYFLSLYFFRLTLCVLPKNLTF